MSFTSYGYGDGDGYGYGFSDGDGYGDGDGHANGDGHGYGYEDGSGYSLNDLVGDGDGDGSGHGGDNEVLQSYLRLAADAGTLTARHALTGRGSQNDWLSRLVIEALGPDRFFGTCDTLEIVHRDLDGYGHPRLLVRAPCPQAEAGYLQAVHIVCPTTGRQYYLGVPPGVRTCQEAVASTFGIQASEYHPVRET